MRDLYKSCHRDKSDTRQTSEDPGLAGLGPLSANRHFSQELIEGTMEELLERATPTEAFERDKNHCGVCRPLSCYKVVLGLVLALHHVLFREGLVRSRLLF